MMGEWKGVRLNHGLSRILQISRISALFCVAASQPRRGDIYIYVEKRIVK